MSTVDTRSEALKKAKRLIEEGRCLSEYLFAVSDDLVWIKRSEFESLHKQSEDEKFQEPIPARTG